jgi:hypothetical protein
LQKKNHSVMTINLVLLFLEVVGFVVMLCSEAFV